MRGYNTLVLNTATMMEAMQEYLDKRMGEFAPQVVNVEGKSNLDKTFEVKVQEKEPTP